MESTIPLRSGKELHEATRPFAMESRRLSWWCAGSTFVLLASVLERWKIGRIPAVLVTAFMGFSLMGILAWTAVVQLTSLAPKIPEYQHNIEVKLNTVNQVAVTMLTKFTRTMEGMGQSPSPSELSVEPLGTSEHRFAVRVLSSPASPLHVFGGIYGTLLEVLGATSFVIVLVVFFLVRREDLRDRFIHLFGKGHVTVTT